MHKIQLVENSALPPEHDFIVVQQGDRDIAFYREASITPETVEQAWSALLALA